MDRKTNRQELKYKPIAMIDISGTRPAINIGDNNLNNVMTPLFVESNTIGSATIDVSRSFILGKQNQSYISNSLIVGNENKGFLGGSSDLSGGIFVLGRNNTVKDINSIILSEDNTINDAQTIPATATGNFVMGKNNTYVAASNSNQNNIIVGEGNILGNGHFSWMYGKNNKIYGSYLNVYGSDNKIADIDDTTNKDYFVSQSLIHGEKNEINVPYQKTLKNSYLLGYKNVLDLSSATINYNYVQDKSYLLLGSYAKIGPNDPIRFAFSSKEKYDERGGAGVDASGNVFTIDCSGNIEAFGDVSGVNLFTSGDLTITGNLTVNGTTTTVNSEVTTVDVPIFALGGDTAPTSDDNLDRGISFRYFDTSAKLGFMGYDDSESKFVLLTDATDISQVFTGT